MRLIWLFLFCLIVADTLQGSANRAESSKFVSTSSQIYGVCGECAKPMLTLFVNQMIEEIENKRNKIRQLQEKLNNLQLETDGKNEKIHRLELEIAGSRLKDRIIELLKTNNESTEDHIKSLKNEIQILMKSIEIQSSSSCEKQNREVAQLTEKIKSETLKVNKYASQLMSKQEVIAANDKKVNQLETEVKRLTDKSNELESLKQQLSLIKNTNEQQNHNLTELNKGIRVEAAKAIKCETELKSKQEVIAANDKKVYQLERDIKRLTDKSNELESVKQQLSLIKNTNEQQNHNLTELNKGIRVEAAKAIKCETELKNVRKISDENQEKLNQIENYKISKGCIARDSTGVYNTTIGNNIIEVLCNSDIAGPGWTIIQQRIKGGVDFNMNWETYRKGFGDFWDGDFFLGLENIHKLTTEKTHELYIHIEKFDGNTFYARYNKFAISGEDDQYRLKVGEFSGSIGDKLAAVNNKKFSTKDRDNDEWKDGNLAVRHNGGWWYTLYAESNLNGVFFEKYKIGDNTINWVEWYSLKKVVMLVRPRTI